jgi:hypothetical protein
VPQPFEFADESCKRGPGDIGGESLVSVAATLVVNFCDGTELLAAGLGESGCARSRLPFAFVSPCLEARLAAVTAGRRLVQQKASEDATSDRSAESVLKYGPKPREISDTFGRRRLGDAAGGIPIRKTAYSVQKAPESAGVQRNLGGLGGPLAPEKISGGGNKLNNSVRLDSDELGEEIIFAAEVRHRRDPAETVAVARASEAGRQPGGHQIFVGEIRGRWIDDGGSGIDAGLDRVWLYEVLAEAVNRCAGDFVKGARGNCNGLTLFDGKACWQRKLQFGRYAAVAE